MRTENRMATTDNSGDPIVKWIARPRCGICHEGFEEQWMADRCEAQGTPPFLVKPKEILYREPDPHLWIIRWVRVHHGDGKCPINGPCEHAVRYMGFKLWACEWKWVKRRQRHSSPAWMVGGGSDTLLSAIQSYEHVCQSTQNWGVIEMRDPSIYIAKNIESSWERLWELYKTTLARCTELGIRTGGAC